MRDPGDVLRAYAELARRGGKGVLASVVHTAGSTYRKPGARMLFLPGDATVGLIGGGCLERDLLEHARRVREDRRSRLLHYATTPGDDEVWGLGLGCAGVVDVLLEPVDAERPGPLDWIAAWRAVRARGAIATSLADRDLGRRLGLHPDGRLEARPAGPIDAAEVEQLREARARGRSRRVRNPSGDLALDVVEPAPRLVIFGAGPDAQPVVGFARDLGWDVAVVDARRARLRPELLPGARLHEARPDRAVAAAGIDSETYTIVMTHHFPHDREILAGLLRSAAPYIGLLGPRRRAEDLLADLSSRGEVVTDEQRERVFAPAGLDLGGEDPAAIALALVGEVQARAAGRSGGWLRDRKGPIHDPTDA